jgi:hypothetical protein
VSRGHRGGAGSGNPEQGAGKRRGIETGNGYTASTGRGRPDRVTFQGVAPESAGKRSVLRIIADVIKPRKK